MKTIGYVALLACIPLCGCAGDEKDDKEKVEKSGDTRKHRGDRPDQPDKDGPRLPPLDSAEWKEIPDMGGLKKWDVKEGEGEVVKPGSTVRVHYTGWLKNGTIFDSSVTRGETIEFSLNGVIKGWTEGIPGMKAGGIRRLMIPAAMAYGERAQGGIPANSDLVFEVEVIDGKPKIPPVDAKEWKEVPDKGGLKIWDVKEGTGEPAKAGDSVTIHYTGWLKDGTVFDTSRLKGKKATFPLGKLIKGWQEGVPGMKPGGVRRLYIPYAMAYGENGKSTPDGRKVIPDKADLIFEIELFESK